MKLIQNKLYLTFQEMLECGFSENTLKDAKKKGTKCWDFLDDPEDRRRVLVGYEALNDERKRMVMVRFGNPYDHVARQPILDMVARVLNVEAHDYFLGYTYEGGVKRLDIKTVNKYTRADKWLRMLVELDKQVVKKLLGITLADFYLHTGSLIGLERERGKDGSYEGLEILPGDFPGSYRKLIAKVDKYKTEGYQGIIDSRLENKNAAKLGKVSPSASSKPAGKAGELIRLDAIREVLVPNNGLITSDLVPENTNKGGGFDPELRERQLAVIRHCSRLANNLDAGQVQNMANTLFRANGWETVSIATVRNIIKENENILTPGRRGKRTYMNNVAMQNKRRAPQFPMVYWTLDGWTAELMYQERTAKGVEYKRMVVVVVLDACGKYPIGYAIGDRENVQLIKDACRNAIAHTSELFGQPHQPLQLQSDNYQIKNLTPFYQAVKALYFTPAAVGNAKAKVIEPYFKDLNKNYCQAQCANWSGFNVDASKENQVNREWLDMIKTSFPDKAGVIKQIHGIMAQERQTKVADYMAKWAELPEKDRKPMGVMDYLMVFGEQLGDRTNKITGQGIIKQVNGAEYTYESFDPAFRDHMHLDWQLFGDMADLSRVLAVSADGKIRFVLEQKRELPMDLYSTTQADVDYRMQVKYFNEDRMQDIIDLTAKDADVVQDVLRQAQGDNGQIGYTEEQQKALQLMLTVKGQQKEGIQDAKRLGQVQRKHEKKVERELVLVEKVKEDHWERQQQEFLKSKTDLNKYLD